MKLRDIQLEFLNSILQNRQPAAFVLPKATSFERVRVYRNNFMYSHVDSLKKVYKIVATYLKDTFEDFAIKYVCENRPLHGETLSEYGENFWECLEQSWLQDLAKFEWAMYRVSIAKPDIDALTHVSGEPTNWVLRTDVALLGVNHNILKLSENIEFGKPLRNIDTESSFYAFFRPKNELQVSCLALDKDGFDFLDALRCDAFSVDELFDKLTICQDKFITLIQSIFIKDLVKGANVSNVETSKADTLI